MVKSCPIVEWSVIRMPFKYQTKFNPMFKWWSEYQNYNLNTRQVKHCYSVIQMFVIQIPTVYNPWNSFVALGIIVHSTLNLKRFSHQSMLQSSAAGIWCRTLLYCYEMSGRVTFSRRRYKSVRALCLPHNYFVLPSSVVHWHWKREYLVSIHCVSLLELPATINLYKYYKEPSIIFILLLVCQATSPTSSHSPTRCDRVSFDVSSRRKFRRFDSRRQSCRQPSHRSWHTTQDADERQDWCHAGLFTART